MIKNFEEEISLQQNYLEDHSDLSSDEDYPESYYKKYERMTKKLERKVKKAQMAKPSEKLDDLNNKLERVPEDTNQKVKNKENKANNLEEQNKKFEEQKKKEEQNKKDLEKRKSVDDPRTNNQSLPHLNMPLTQPKLFTELNIHDYSMNLISNSFCSACRVYLKTFNSLKSHIEKSKIHKTNVLKYFPDAKSHCIPPGSIVYNPTGNEKFTKFHYGKELQIVIIDLRNFPNLDRLEKNLINNNSSVLIVLNLFDVFKDEKLFSAEFAKNFSYYYRSKIGTFESQGGIGIFINKKIKTQFAWPLKPLKNFLNIKVNYDSTHSLSIFACSINLDKIEDKNNLLELINNTPNNHNSNALGFIKTTSELNNDILNKLSEQNIKVEYLAEFKIYRLYKGEITLSKLFLKTYLSNTFLNMFLKLNCNVEYNLKIDDIKKQNTFTVLNEISFDYFDTDQEYQNLDYNSHLLNFNNRIWPHDKLYLDSEIDVDYFYIHNLKNKLNSYPQISSHDIPLIITNYYPDNNSEEKILYICDKLLKLISNCGFEIFDHIDKNMYINLLFQILNDNIKNFNAQCGKIIENFITNYSENNNVDNILFFNTKLFWNIIIENIVFKNKIEYYPKLRIFVNEINITTILEILFPLNSATILINTLDNFPLTIAIKSQYALELLCETDINLLINYNSNTRQLNKYVRNKIEPEIEEFREEKKPYDPIYDELCCATSVFYPSSNFYKTNKTFFNSKVLQKLLDHIKEEGSKFDFKYIKFNDLINTIEIEEDVELIIMIIRISKHLIEIKIPDFPDKDAQRKLKEYIQNLNKREANNMEVKFMMDYFKV